MTAWRVRSCFATAVATANGATMQIRAQRVCWTNFFVSGHLIVSGHLTQGGPSLQEALGFGGGALGDGRGQPQLQLIRDGSPECLSCQGRSERTSRSTREFGPVFLPCVCVCVFLHVCVSVSVSESVSVSVSVFVSVIVFVIQEGAAQSADPSRNLYPSPGPITTAPWPPRAANGDQNSDAFPLCHSCAVSREGLQEIVGHLGSLLRVFLVFGDGVCVVGVGVGGWAGGGGRREAGGGARASHAATEHPNGIGGFPMIASATKGRRQPGGVTTKISEFMSGSLGVDSFDDATVALEDPVQHSSA